MHPAGELLETFLGCLVRRHIVSREANPCQRKKLFRCFARVSRRGGINSNVLVHGFLLSSYSRLGQCRNCTSLQTILGLIGHPRVSSEHMNRNAIAITLITCFSFLSTLTLADQSQEESQTTNPHASHTTSVSKASDSESWREAHLLSNIRQLTFAGKRAGEGYFSPDGSQLVLQSEREPGNPFFQIYRMDLKNGATRRVSPGIGKTTCAWFHPSQDKMLFASTHEDPDVEKKQKAEIEERNSGKERRYEWDFDEHYDIFEATEDGQELKNLTKAKGYDAEGSWSPDGRMIAFASNRHAYSGTLSGEERERFQKDPSSQMDIYIMQADGSDAQQLTTTLGYDGGPFFSPDGKRIVWRRFSPDGAQAEVWTMRIDGTDQKQITRLQAMSWAPYFHPSGDYLIFTTNLHGFRNFELYIVDTEGRSEPVRITYTKGFDGLPVFAPNGEQLAWTSGRTVEKKAQIFFADWNDAEARCLLGLESNPSKTSESVRTCELRRFVTDLASEKMAGRLTGTEGERLATEYAAALLEKNGLEPAGDDGTFFQSFEFTAGVSLGPKNSLSISDNRESYTIDKDWRPLTFSKTGEFDPTAVVFAGYGIVAPASDEHGEYDSYAHLDVTDKWVLIFRYLPEDIDVKYRQHLNRYASLRYKAMVARDRGARGLIIVSGPNTKVKEKLVTLSFDASLAGTSIGALSVTDTLAEEWLKLFDKSLKELQDTLDTGQLTSGFDIRGLTLKVIIDIQQEKRHGRNVLARLRASAQAAKTGMIVVGAHIDHLGNGLGNGSLARGDEKGQIHFGADDNASGAAAVLGVAKTLAAQQAKGEVALKRDVLFALWSGEEMGLLGSSHFVKTFGQVEKEPKTLAPAITAYLNMDMVGRLDSALVMQGVGSSSVWPEKIEQQNVPIGLPITLQNDSYLPTDATAFYLKQVPILNAFTGGHAEYHSPRDTVEKLNYAGLKKIAQLMTGLTRSLASSQASPDYIEIAKPKSPVGRVQLRAYLGTIPDYAQGNITGVKLSGVAKGGPADLAGVRGGDVVVELAGKAVENIYDYTYVVGSLKIGEPVGIAVMRNGQRTALTITPTSRE